MLANAHLACALVLLVPCLGGCVGSRSEASAKTPLLKGSASSNEAFVVFGKIIDSEERPLSGVEVSAHCGNGTLLPTGSTQTDANGEYRLSFGPGVRMGRVFDVGPFGAGFQAATVSAHKRGYFLKGLGRSGNLAMSDSTNSPPAWSSNFVGVVRPFHPYRLDFALEPAAIIRGRFVDSSQRLPPKLSLCLKGEKLPPSSSVLACVELAEDGEFEFPDVPVGFCWWFEITWSEKGTWRTLRSGPVVASAPAPSNMNVTMLDDALQVEQFR